MLNSFSVLALLCSIGSILVVLGIILTIPAIWQILMLLVGLFLCGTGIFGVAKVLVSGRGN